MQILLEISPIYIRVIYGKTFEAFEIGSRKSGQGWPLLTVPKASFKVASETSNDRKYLFKNKMEN